MYNERKKEGEGAWQEREDRKCGKGMEEHKEKTQSS